MIGWLVTLRTPLFDLGIQGAPAPHGAPAFETAFSGRDLILLGGGLFLLWKATREIHHAMDPEGDSGELLDKDKSIAGYRLFCCNRADHRARPGVFDRLDPDRCRHD